MKLSIYEVSLKDSMDSSSLYIPMIITISSSLTSLTYHDTVEAHYNTVWYNNILHTALQWSWWNTDHTLTSNLNLKDELTECLSDTAEHPLQLVSICSFTHTCSWEWISKSTYKTGISHCKTFWVKLQSNTDGSLNSCVFFLTIHK